MSRSKLKSHDINIDLSLVPASDQETGHAISSIEHSDTSLAAVLKLVQDRGGSFKSFLKMVSQVVLSDGLTVQFLANIILGGVRLATKYFLNAQM